MQNVRRARGRRGSANRANRGEVGMTDGGDVMDALAGLPTGSSLAVLRRQRPDVVAHIEGSDAAVFAPANDAGLSRAERASLALHIATLLREPQLAQHYQARLAALQRGEVGATVPTDGADRRWMAILGHAERVTLDPSSARREHIAALVDAGLSPRAVVALAELIAYVNFQARVLAGLAMLKAEQ
jgi:CMD domain protein